MRRAALIAVAATLGCAARGHVQRALPPLGADGAVSIYVQPFPAQAARVALTIASASLVRADGGEVPLELATFELSGAPPARQRLLAAGRVPPGRYGALALKLRRATVTGESGTTDLHVGDGAVRVDLLLEVPQGAARVVQLSLRPAAPDAAFDLGAALRAAVLDPTSAAVALSGYVSIPRTATLAVFERRAKQVTALIPTGREPQGVAVDALAQRGYVALAGDDQVQVIDLATGHDLARFQLRTADEPGELALTPDGRVVVVLGVRSGTATFLDAQTGAVLERVAVGRDPGALVMGAGGRRAYVLNRDTNDLTVLDVGTRTVAATLATDPEPVRAALNAAETRLYVVHRGSAYLKVLSLPELATVGRMFVGLGASAVRVDPRNDRVYVASEAEGRIQVIDPGSLVQVDSIELPGPASLLLSDELENALVAVIPSLGAVAYVDLTSRRVAGVIEVGSGPFQAAIIGGRP